MSEIINIQIGKCGNNIGTNFFEVISDEHGIEPTGIYNGNSDFQLQKINVYYNESTQGKYTPLSILVDLDPITIDSVLVGPYGKLFHIDNCIVSRSGTSNIYAKGHYSEDSDLLYLALDVIRKEAERSENPKSFQITHSIGGGTGSGLGTLIMSNLQDLYPKHLINTFTVFPSNNTTDNVVESYNALLSSRLLINASDMNQVFDNKVLLNICTKYLQQNNSSYNDLNNIVSSFMSGITSSMRFKAEPYTNFRKLLVNLIPYSRIHFLVPGHAPFLSKNLKSYYQSTLSSITKKCLNKNNMLCDSNPYHGRCLSSAIIYRGNVSNYEVEHQIKKMRSDNEHYFYECFPNSTTVSVCNVVPKGQRLSASFLLNSYCITEIFKRIEEMFEPMFKKKAFLHWYLKEGMEEAEFTEAESELSDLICEYMPSCDCDYYYDEEYEDVNNEDNVENDQENNEVNGNENEENQEEEIY